MKLPSMFEHILDSHGARTELGMLARVGFVVSAIVQPRWHGSEWPVTLPPRSSPHRRREGALPLHRHLTAKPQAVILLGR
jgi:hypothetical protein